MKDVLHKVKWAASKKQEAVMKLQAEVATYIGSINILLCLYEVFVYRFQNTLVTELMNMW